MEIEFIEHQPPDPVSGDVAPIPPPGAPVLGSAAALAFGAAAALAALAPFQRLYSIRISVTGYLERVAVDGWGRTALTVTNGTVTPQHGPRYGIVFTVLGSVCVLLALVTTAFVVRHRSSVLDVILVAAGAITSTALGTSVAVTWLEVQSRVDNARELSHDRIGETLAEHVAVRTSYGSGVLLGLVATGCAVVGTVLWEIHRRTAGRFAAFDPGIGAPPEAVEPDGPGQELEERLPG